jgi:SAM-dependent methyltransferase
MGWNELLCPSGHRSLRRNILTTVTHREVQEYISTFEWFREPAMQGYLAAALDRLVTTLNLIPRLPNPQQVRVLEIGGMPYFMTVLVKKFLGYEVEVANEPTLERGRDGNLEVLENDHGERHEVRYKTLNIEYDRWPWEDDTFDLVLYCEVIEHLVYDPTHTLVEAHRVLKNDSGRLLVSTPNALCYTYLVQMLHGENFYPPYSGHSHYARHHRLFSPQELAFLCTQVGYQVQESYSLRDEAYDHPPRWEPLVRALTSMGKLRNRLDVIYLLATPHGRPRYAYPAATPYVVYQDVNGYEEAVRASTRKSGDIAPPVLSGFFDLEPWGGGVRWTGPAAEVALRPRGHEKVVITFYTGPAARGPEVRGWIELRDTATGTKQRHDLAVASDTWQTLELPLPADVSGDLVMEITVDKLLIPCELDPRLTDDRELGIAVRDVVLR